MSFQIIPYKYKMAPWKSSPGFSSLPQETTGHEGLDQAITLAGYSYDPVQDIFYSTIDPWQKDMGYCRLYDDASALLGMIIDCEPIYFSYKGKKWMISFWKGQYDLVTGCEIGVYIERFDINIPSIFKGIFFRPVSEDDYLQMSFTLKKKDQILFTRKGKHWWLTGFKLGEFSEPFELSMDVKIVLRDEIMRDAFIIGLRDAGYSDSEFNVVGNSVLFTFDIPHTRQPMTRTAKTDNLIQRKNKLLCDLYQTLTGEYDNLPDKINALEEQSSGLYKKVLKLGKTRPSIELYILIVIIAAALLWGLHSEIAKAEQL
jgi:hypothetical protein